MSQMKIMEEGSRRMKDERKKQRMIETETRAGRWSATIRPSLLNLPNGSTLPPQEALLDLQSGSGAPPGLPAPGLQLCPLWLSCQVMCRTENSSDMGRAEHQLGQTLPECQRPQGLLPASWLCPRASWPALLKGQVYSIKCRVWSPTSGRAGPEHETMGKRPPP